MKASKSPKTISVEKLKIELIESILSCKDRRKGLSEYDHDRIALTGMILAYENIMNDILESEYIKSHLSEEE
jgi:hypothetical protein